VALPERGPGLHERCSPSCGSHDTEETDDVEVGNIGPYPRYYRRNPGIAVHALSLFKNFPFGSEGKRYAQFRLETFNVFNHPQFSGRNQTPNVTNPTITNNLRPSGSTSVLGTYFGEYSAARDMRVVQVAVKLYF
jgi:hypothetical protein